MTNVGQQGLYQMCFGEALGDEMSPWTWDTRGGRSKGPSQEHITAKASDGAIRVGGTGIKHKIQLETTSGKQGEHYTRNGSTFLHSVAEIQGSVRAVQYFGAWAFRKRNCASFQLCKHFHLDRGDSNARAVFSRGDELSALLEWGRKSCLSSSGALRGLGDYKAEQWSCWYKFRGAKWDFHGVPGKLNVLTEWICHLCVCVAGEGIFPWNSKGGKIKDRRSCGLWGFF